MPATTPGHATESHVEYSKRAKKDLKKRARRDAERLGEEIEARLTPRPPPDNADIDWIKGTRRGSDCGSATTA